MSDERIPRATLQKRLENLLTRIDSAKVFRVEWTNTLLGRERRASSFEVDAVYVVGSFARGALLCGDLDVVLMIRLTDGYFPPESTIAHAVAKGLRHVQVLIGTSTTLAKFPDAILLWSQAARDWRQPLDAIRVDPDAGHFARPTDALPLALRQMRLYDLKVAEKVAQEIADGILASEWWPLERPASAAPPAWDDETTRWFDFLMKQRGKDSKAILPHVFRYLWETKRTGAFSDEEPTEFLLGSTLVRFGRPLLDVHPLNRPGTTAIVMAPHLTRRRPNGLWILSKGPAHPAHALFANLTFWAELDEDGHVPLAHIYESPNDWRPTHLDAELFSTERKARSFAREMEGDPKNVASISGTRLLDEIGHADMVWVDSQHALCLTYTGRRYENGPPPPLKLREIDASFDRTPLPTCEDLATWLRTATRRSRGKSAALASG